MIQASVVLPTPGSPWPRLPHLRGPSKGGAALTRLTTAHRVVSPKAMSELLPGAATTKGMAKSRPSQNMGASCPACEVYPVMQLLIVPWQRMRDQMLVELQNTTSQRGTGATCGAAPHVPAG